MADMFKKIKKQNGERFAKAIRAYDNGIFDIENLDQIVKYAGREAEPIMDYLISLKGVEIAEHTVSKTPLQLLDEAGYDAYYADTLEKQNAISKYYADEETLRDLATQGRISRQYASNGEGLCTFRDPHRFEKYYIINAVRKDVDDIRREDFPNPEREDKYGTSVLSIQVLKTGGFISIKNRYNHTVQNPDNTLNSNPDNIIEGLSMAIKQHFNVDFSSKKAWLPFHYTSINNQIIKYEREENNIYIGDNFYVKDGVVTELNKDYQEMIDHAFILDKKNGTITDICSINDSFTDVLQNEISGKKISVSKYKESDTTKILVDGQELCTLQSGQITRLNLLEATEIPDNFLSKVKLPYLKELNAPKVKRIGDNSFNGGSSFLMDAPELEEIGNNTFSGYNLNTYICMPMIRKIGNNSVEHIDTERMTFDHLEEVGNESLCNVRSNYFPKLKKAGDNFCGMCLGYEEELYVPELEEVGDNCFCNAGKVEDLNFPKLRIAGNNFLRGLEQKEKGRRVNLPSLEQVGDNFMCGGSGWGVCGRDYSLAELNAPKLETVGKNFMERCTDIGQMNMPSEVNVQVEYHENEIEAFMPKMPEGKRPKPIALEPKFCLVFDVSSEQSQKDQGKTNLYETPAVIDIDVLTEPIVSKSDLVNKVSNVIEEPRVSQAQPLENSQKPIGLKNRLYELSEKGRLERMIDTVKGIFFKHHKNQR
ncbi:MAG: leucine-rich repeat protein [Alphaproteobacteria bacterium]|nr:leucine-rich repeat protein [Alphaproteobacteria bacterium]